jgi:YfiH family protein
VLTADCVPVLFADAEAGIIGAAHAGWKGAVAGVCEATIDAMEKLGAKREAIMASIGPSISQRSYEVGPEFRAQFRAADAEAFFIAATTPEHFMFDLKGFVAQILKRAGVGQVDILPHCTYAQAEKFFSYRRTTHAQEADYGRQISAISLVA